jgi:hypothetical protein
VLEAAAKRAHYPRDDGLYWRQRAEKIREKCSLRGRDAA